MKNRSALAMLLSSGLVLFSISSYALDFIGHARANNPVDVVAEIDGVVENAQVELGDQIAKNDNLISLNAKDFQLVVHTEQANVELAKANVKIKHSVFQRYLELKQKKSISQNELDIAETEFDVAKANLKLAKVGLQKALLDLSRTQITSDISGYVSRRNIENGSWVNQGDLLYQIVNIDTINIRLLASEYEINSLQVGQNIQVWAESNPQLTVIAKIQRIGIEFEQGSFAYPIDIEIANPEKSFKPGMSIHATTDVTLSVNTSTPAVQVISLLNDNK